MTPNERRRYRRMPWLQVPSVKRYEDTLPDFSRTAILNAIISVPRECWFEHVSPMLYGVYVKQRRVWSDEHPLTPYDPMK